MSWSLSMLLLLAATAASALQPVTTRRGALDAAAASSCAAAFGVVRRPAGAAVPLCDEAVSLLRKGDQEVFLVGTAHVSKYSAQLVADTIDAVKPTLIMVELDAKRVSGFGGTADAPAKKLPPANLGQRVGAFLVGSVLKRMYASLDKLGLDTGAEFSVALQLARDGAVPLLLADRDVDETLRRLSDAVRATTSDELERFDAAIGASLASQLSAKIDDKDAVAASVELIKKRDTVRKLVGGLKDNVPELYEALVDSRDAYMTASLLDRLAATGRGPQRVVAVVGMAHEDGISSRLAARGFVPKKTCAA